MDIDTKNGVEIFQTFELSDGARTVTILASKEEEERINQDQEYATQRFLSAVGEYNVTEEGEEDFNHNATLLLIECIRDRFEKFCSSRQERNQVYKEIQEELRSYSYNLPLDKIRSKWNNLITTYKRIKDRHKAGSTGRRVWDYFQPLDDLLGPTFEAAGPDGLSMLTVKPHIIKSSHQASSAPTVLHKASVSPELSSTPPLVYSPALPQSTIAAPSSSTLQENKRKTSDSTSVIIDQSDKGERRQDMMEQYFHQLKDKETKEEDYRRRKERRERMKLRALQKIGRELQSIAKIQLEILKKQDLILEAVNRSKT